MSTRETWKGGLWTDGDAMILRVCGDGCWTEITPCADERRVTRSTYFVSVEGTNEYLKPAHHVENNHDPRAVRPPLVSLLRVRRT